MKGIFNLCPSCSSEEISVQKVVDSGSVEYCLACNFAANYVRFTCGHCNPDIFAICPHNGCNRPGSPTKRLCIRGS